MVNTIRKRFKADVSEKPANSIANGKTKVNGKAN